MSRAATLEEVNAELAQLAEEMRARWQEVIELEPGVLDSLPPGPVRDLMTLLGDQMGRMDEILAKKVDVAFLRDKGASLEEIGERLGWSEVELSHARGCLDTQYEDEACIVTQSGRELRFPAYPKEVDYVRVVDHGFELAYWVDDEFAEDPRCVLGAMLGCAMASVQARQRQDLAEYFRER